jgi:hypothetical protein
MQIDKFVILALVAVGIIVTCVSMLAPQDSGISISKAERAAANADFDRDGFSNAVDNCPAVMNPDQADADSDGVGNTCDHPPIANAGPDQTASATSLEGARIALDGSSSSDPDGDDLAYRWHGAFGTLHGRTIEITLPIGVHLIFLSVDDGKGGTATDEVTVTVAA